MTQKQHETTEKESRSNNLDLDEALEIEKRALNGDEKAMQKHERYIKQWLKEAESNTDVLSCLDDIVNAYISWVNREHGTDFDNITDTIEYLRENGEIVGNNIVFAAKPKNYVRMVDKVTTEIFSGIMENKKRYRIQLDYKKTANVYVTINYDEVFKNLPPDMKGIMPKYDYLQVLNGIHSLLEAQNHIMTYKMIYRAFTGDENCRRLPQDMFDHISKALTAFRGLLTIKNVEGARNFKEPILSFKQFEDDEEVVINGQKFTGQDGVVIVYDYSPLYYFAKENGNEIDKRDIRLLNVPGINNTPQNLRLKSYLYDRVTVMRSNYERQVLFRHKRMSVSRKIRYDAIFDAIKDTDEEEKKVIDKKKKDIIKGKIKKILSYWQDYGLFESVNYKITKPGSKEHIALEINFIKEEEKKESDAEEQS